MRTFLLAAVATLSIGLNTQAARADGNVRTINGFDLRTYCNGPEGGQGFTACEFYAGGIFEGLMSGVMFNAAPNAQPDKMLEICSPSDGVSFFQMALIVRKYISDNPQNLNWDGMNIVGSALHNAFPCQ